MALWAIARWMGTIFDVQEAVLEQLPRYAAGVDTEEANFPGAWGTRGRQMPQSGPEARRKKVQGLGQE